MGPRDVEQAFFARYPGMASSSSSCWKIPRVKREPRERLVIVIDDDEKEEAPKQQPVPDLKEQEVIVIDDDEGGSCSGDTSDSDLNAPEEAQEVSSSSSTEVVNDEEDELQFVGSRFRSAAPRRYSSDESSEEESSEAESECEVITSQQWREAGVRRKAGAEPAEQGGKRVKTEAQSTSACVVNNAFEDDVTNAEAPTEAPECSTNAGVGDLSKVRSPNRSCSTTRGESPAKAKLAEDSTVLDREVARQAPEFQQADQQEWASRQLELQKQALEIQKLKRRRKAEAERKLQMESRQKQRLQEMRESQMKEEQTLGMKEQLRGHVQAELERIALRCVDLASLLQKLGINLGGSPPSVDQVNAGYKQALFRFHPDRASTRGDIRSQVEAEEKFKLISRMKNVLRPVSSFKL